VTIAVTHGGFTDAVDVWQLRCESQPAAARDQTRSAIVLHETQAWLLGLGGEVVLIARDGAGKALGFIGLKPGRVLGTDASMWQAFVFFVVESARRGPAGYRLVRSALRVLDALKVERFQFVTANRKLERFAVKVLGMEPIGRVLEGGTNGRPVRRADCGAIAGQEVHQAVGR
jgi:hypothetical protein